MKPFLPESPRAAIRGMTERTCLGCRMVLEKGSMVRLAVKDGRVVPDLDGRLGGRGAYVCSEKCLKEACKRKDAFNRAFKARIEHGGLDSIWELVRAARPSD